MTVLALGALMLTACGAGSTPAGPAASTTKPITAQAYTIYSTTWAGGRCTFRQWTDGAYSGEVSEVSHANNGYVRLWVKILTTGNWDKQETRGYVSLGTNSSIEVYAWCKVDGNWVGGLKYRTR
ncbi:hypothetical protein [Deinococcus hohokamensis]